MNKCIEKQRGQCVDLLQDSYPYTQIKIDLENREIQDNIINFVDSENDEQEYFDE
mgnify:CR=1 FL=1